MVVHCTGLRDRESLIEEAVETLLTTLELSEILERTALLMRKHFGGTRVGITRWRPDDPDVVEVLKVYDDHHPTPAPGTVLSLGSTATGAAIRTGSPVTIDHIAPGGGRYREEEELARYGYGALACFPLIAEGRILGTFEIAHMPKEEMLCRCFQPADRVSKLIAIALHNSLMVTEIQRLNRLLDRENARLKDQIQQAREQQSYIAVGPAMRAVMEKVAMVAPSETTVLVRGETGTGKEGIARLLHQQSRRSAGPFVAVNLAAIPEPLIESELFGHERGAFTGAGKRKLGRFEQATGGTLFLDEVGDAPASVQVKILRALQEREIQRVGGERAVKVDIRLVAATNRPLERLSEEGAFRADLYYRLNIFPVVLPPLRERPEDLRPLVKHLLERHARRMHRRPPEIDDATWSALAAYTWPGNVRELENTLERALILSPGDRLLLPELGGLGPGETSATMLTGSQRSGEHPPSDAHPSARKENPGNDSESDPEILPFDEAVKDLLRRALDRTRGRIYGPRGAAALLGLRPTTLQGKLRKHGLR